MRGISSLNLVLLRLCAVKRCFNCEVSYVESKHCNYDRNPENIIPRVNEGRVRVDYECRALLLTTSSDDGVEDDSLYVHYFTSAALPHHRYHYHCPVAAVRFAWYLLVLTYLGHLLAGVRTTK